MKIIVPIAGLGTRVRPHTFTKPKPFVPLAGKHAIDFLMEHLLTSNPEEVIIVHDKFTYELVEEYFPKQYPDVNFKFATQKESLGTGHAIYQAKEFIKEGDDVLVAYCDAIFEKDFGELKNLKEDGIIFAVKVKDPQNYGVLEHDENMVITKQVEKPKEPKSDLINIGVYYFKEGYEFINKYVKKVIDQGPNEKGEYYLTDSFTFMIEDGKRLIAEPVVYYDTGTVEKLVEANKYLLQGKFVKGKNVVLENCEIGENVSIGDNTKLVNCKIKNSIIGKNTFLEGLEIEESLIGNNIHLKKDGKVFNIGDKCSCH